MYIVHIIYIYLHNHVLYNVHNVQVFGAVKTFDLKENGGDTAVSEANRREYVDLYVQWLLVDSVKDQYGPFER